MANVGTLDRIIRVIVGLALIVVPFAAGWSLPAAIAGVIVGAILLATSAFSFCPIYAALGLSSKGKSRLENR